MDSLKYYLDDTISPRGIAHLMARVIPSEIVKEIASLPAAEAMDLFFAQLNSTIRNVNSPPYTHEWYR